MPGTTGTDNKRAKEESTLSSVSRVGTLGQPPPVLLRVVTGHHCRRAREFLTVSPSLRPCDPLPLQGQRVVLFQQVAAIGVPIFLLCR